MIIVNLYYTGTNGNARKFAEEMESSGTADKIRSESGNISTDVRDLLRALLRFRRMRHFRSSRR